MTKSSRYLIFVFFGVIVIAAVLFTWVLHDIDKGDEDGRHGVEPVPAISVLVPRSSAFVREPTSRELDKTPTRRPRDVSQWRAHVDALDQLSSKGDMAASIQLYQEAANCDHFNRVMHSALSDL